MPKLQVAPPKPCIKKFFLKLQKTWFIYFSASDEESKLPLKI
jgi:hypothetical protein